MVFFANYVAAIFFFFYFPVLGMEPGAVDGHPDNRSVVSLGPVSLM